MSIVCHAAEGCLKMLAHRLLTRGSTVNLSRGGRVLSHEGAPNNAVGLP